MLIEKWLPRFSLIGLSLLFVAATSAPASANMLANPGFESGLAGWFTFGNVFPEAANPPAIVPLSGNGVAKMFGGFSGGFNVGGMFQEFPAAPGTHWQMSSNARHWSGDPLVGAVPTGNWVVQKIVFKDAGDAEIGAAESVILDGTFPADVWHAAAPILGIAPAGTVQVEAFILFLQPALDGGAALIDDVSLTDVTPVPAGVTTWGRMKAQYKD
jgi:hypothetical protein